LKNRLKVLIREGKIAIGASVSIGHPDVAEVIGLLGFDWVFYDMEHTPMSLETVQTMMQAMSFSPATPVIRVAWNDPVLVKKALDIGAHGVIVPMVNTGEEAERAVKAVRYPPLGMRGFGPRRAARADPDYVSTANKEIFLGIQVESRKAVENIDDILSVEGIDAVLLGPYDLSLNLGVLAQWDSDLFKSSIEKILSAAKKHNVAPGNLAAGDVNKLVNQGFKFLVVDDDIDILRAGLNAALMTTRKAAELGS
jgi:2-keto-3-deoxy-L-rhamnonate aldolase RhmA